MYKQMVTPINLWRRDRVSGSQVTRILFLLLSWAARYLSDHSMPQGRSSSGPRGLLIPWGKQQHEVTSSADYSWHRLPGTMAWTLCVSPAGLTLSLWWVSWLPWDYSPPASCCNSCWWPITSKMKGTALSFTETMVPLQAASLRKSFPCLVQLFTWIKCPRHSAGQYRIPADIQPKSWVFWPADIHHQECSHWPSQYPMCTGIYQVSQPLPPPLMSVLPSRPCRHLLHAHIIQNARGAACLQRNQAQPCLQCLLLVPGL